MKPIDRRPNWYINPEKIRDRHNHFWTKDQLRQIFSMRVLRKEKTSNIIKNLHLKVNKVQIYNVVRVMKKNRLDKCFQCGRVMTTEELAKERGKNFKRCFECIQKNEEYKAKLRKKLLSKNLCGCCGKVPPVSGKTSCKLCLSYTNRHRIAKGFCGNCGDRRINRKRSIALCDVCLDKNLEHSNNYRKSFA